VGAPRIRRRLRDADLRYALQALFGTVHANDTLDETVAGRVTLSLIDAPFETALNRLLAASERPLRFRVEEGVYHITSARP